MPRKPPKACGRAGCKQLAIDQIYCHQHQHEYELKEQKRKALVETKRESSNKRGYNSRWSKARRTFLEHHPVCNECGGIATVVDHKIPHKGDQNLFWNTSNWVPLCSSCHSRKTAMGDGGYGNPTSILGVSDITRT